MVVVLVFAIPGALGAVIAGAEGAGVALVGAIFTMIVVVASGWRHPRWFGEEYWAIPTDAPTPARTPPAGVGQ